MKKPNPEETPKGNSPETEETFPEQCSPAPTAKFVKEEISFMEIPGHKSVSSRNKPAGIPTSTNGSIADALKAAFGNMPKPEPEEGGISMMPVSLKKTTTVSAKEVAESTSNVPKVIRGIVDEIIGIPDRKRTITYLNTELVLDDVIESARQSGFPSKFSAPMTAPTKEHHIALLFVTAVQNQKQMNVVVEDGITWFVMSCECHGVNARYSFTETMIFPAAPNRD